VSSGTDLVLGSAAPSCTWILSLLSFGHNVPDHLENIRIALYRLQDCAARKWHQRRLICHFGA
jgi:hypothetical protein